MARILCISCVAILASCAGNTGRDPLLIATEQRERQKPRLSPAGGTYYGGILVKVVNFREGFEIIDGAAASPLHTAALNVTESRTLTVRDTSDGGLSSTEAYTIVQEIPLAKIQPPAGEYTGTILVTASTEILNAHVEYSSGGEFSTYDPETGIALAQSAELSLRLCVAERCGPLLKASYSITQKPAAEHAATTTDNARLLARLAQSVYSQKIVSGLAARMDEAKLRVIADNTLLSDTSLRGRFLAQHNDVAAASACTTIARYLYVLARRMSESGQPDIVVPDFADYYIRHIRSGDIVQDNGGSFIWIMNGPNLVRPYLSDTQQNAFEYQRGTTYATDYSLLAPVYADKPAVMLMRDSPHGAFSTHTFAAVRAENGFIMLETYFAPWNGIEVRESAGQSWPYAYRFGPAGSRYLHYVYGY